MLLHCVELNDRIIQDFTITYTFFGREEESQLTNAVQSS